MSSKSQLFVIGLTAGVVAAGAYLKLRNRNLLESAEKLSDSVGDNLRELESRLERNLHLELFERSA